MLVRDRNSNAKIDFRLMFGYRVFVSHAPRSIAIEFSKPIQFKSLAVTFVILKLLVLLSSYNYYR